MRNSHFRTPGISAFLGILWSVSDGNLHPLFYLGHSTNRLSVPLFFGSVGTPSHFIIHFVHDNGGKNQNVTKTKQAT